MVLPQPWGAAFEGAYNRLQRVPLQLLLFGTLCINDLQLLSQLTPILQRARNDALVVPAYASSGLYYISAHMVIAHLLYLVGFVSTCAAMLALAAGRRFATGAALAREIGGGAAVMRGKKGVWEMGKTG